MFYITQTGGIDGEFRVSGAGTIVNLLPMDSGIYGDEGLGIFQARDNTKELIIEGSANFTVGTIYAINALLKFQDTSVTLAAAKNLMFVSDKFEISGSSVIDFSIVSGSGSRSVKLVK